MQSHPGDNIVERPSTLIEIVDFQAPEQRLCLKHQFLVSRVLNLVTERTNVIKNTSKHFIESIGNCVYIKMSLFLRKKTFLYSNFQFLCCVFMVSTFVFIVSK